MASHAAITAGFCGLAEHCVPTAASSVPLLSPWATERTTVSGRLGSLPVRPPLVRSLTPPPGLLGAAGPVPRPLTRSLTPPPGLSSVGFGLPAGTGFAPAFSPWSPPVAPAHQASPWQPPAVVSSPLAAVPAAGWGFFSQEISRPPVIHAPAFTPPGVTCAYAAPGAALRASAVGSPSAAVPLHVSEDGPHLACSSHWLRPHVDLHAFNATGLASSLESLYPSHNYSPSAHRAGINMGIGLDYQQRRREPDAVYGLRPTYRDVLEALKVTSASSSLDALSSSQQFNRWALEGKRLFDDALRVGLRTAPDVCLELKELLEQLRSVKAQLDIGDAPRQRRPQAGEHCDARGSNQDTHDHPAPLKATEVQQPLRKVPTAMPRPPLAAEKLAAPQAAEEASQPSALPEGPLGLPCLLGSEVRPLAARRPQHLDRRRAAAGVSARSASGMKNVGETQQDVAQAAEKEGEECSKEEEKEKEEANKSKCEEGSHETEAAKPVARARLSQKLHVDLSALKHLNNQIKCLRNRLWTAETRSRDLEQALALEQTGHREAQEELSRELSERRKSEEEAKSLLDERTRLLERIKSAADECDQQKRHEDERPTLVVPDLGAGAASAGNARLDIARPHAGAGQAAVAAATLRRPPPPAAAGCPARSRPVTPPLRGVSRSPAPPPDLGRWVSQRRAETPLEASAASSAVLTPRGPGYPHATQRRGCVCQPHFR